MKRLNSLPKEEFVTIGRSSSLPELAFQRLKDALISGSLTPGQTVSYRVLAEAFDMSVTPVREAVSRLLADGALKGGQFRSITVPKLTVEKLHEVKSIRIALEGLAAEIGASNIRDDEIRHLELVQMQMAAAIENDDRKVGLRKNQEFHFGIYRASQMDTLVKIIESLWMQIGPSVNLLYPASTREHSGIRNHGKAIEGLRKNDAMAVRAAIEQDIADGAKRLAAVLTATSADD